MERARLGFLAILALVLSGCFTSQTPLILAEDADFPFETIVYREIDDDTLLTMRHIGDAYTIETPENDERLEVRLQDIGAGLYLAQASGMENEEDYILYSVLKVDLENKIAESFLALAEDDLVTDGLRRCDDGAICIDDVNAYIDLARSAIATGDEPNVTYVIVSTE